MFCKSCGKQIDNDSTFCSFCGTKQSTELKPLVQSDEIQSKQLYSNTVQPISQNEVYLSNSPNPVRQTKYDPTYKKEDEAITVGVILLVIALIFSVVGPIKFEDIESYGQFKAVTAIVSLILRILVTVWVVNIAKRQNRETFGWGVFAFLLPSIALIVIATRKKLFANIQIVEGLNNEQNSKILSVKAQEFYNEKKYLESIRFSEKAIELNPSNEIAKAILKKSKVSIAELNNINSSTQGSSVSDGIRIKQTTDGIKLEIHSRLAVGYTVDDKVFINGNPAPSGKYKMGWMDYLTIEDGKIKSL